MNIKFFISDSWACGHVRGEVIARRLNSHTAHCMVCKSDLFYSDLFKTDLMVFQRQHNAGFLPYMAEARRRGIKLVCELDDDLFCIPPESAKAHAFYSRPDVQDGIMAFLREADAVTVSTMHLAERMRERTDRPIYVVENCVDFDYWEQAFMRHAASEVKSVTIGWMASGTHQIDAVLLADVLPRLMAYNPHLRLHLIGWVDVEHLGGSMLDPYRDRIVVQPWIDISELPMAMSDFDIGLAPLVDTPFNRSKSGLKHIQYAALGIPTVASPVKSYEGLIEDGFDGFYARDNKAEAWQETLQMLIDSKELRNYVGMRARENMYKRYDVSVIANHWLSAYDAILNLKGG